MKKVGKMSPFQSPPLSRKSSEAIRGRKRRNFLSDIEPRRKAGIHVKQEVSELAVEIGFEPKAMVIMINVHQAKRSYHGYR